MPHTWCVCSRDVGCRYLLLLLSSSPGAWWMFFPSLREYERPELLLSTSCPLVWLCMIVWTVTLNHLRLSFPFLKLLETLSACSLFTNLRLFLTVPVGEKHLVCKENLQFCERPRDDHTWMKPHLHDVFHKYMYTLIVSLPNHYKKEGNFNDIPMYFPK